MLKFLCEQDKVILRPGVWYRFVVSDSCPDCVALAKAYGYEPCDVASWENEGGPVRL